MIAEREIAEPVDSPPLDLRAASASTLEWLGLGAAEAAAWIGLLAFTALVRFMFLGSPPLNLDESRRALEAYTLLTQGRVVYEGSPILTNLTSIMFGLFTDGEAQARLIAALAGVALVATPFLLRPVIPGLWALLAGGALAVSTILLTGSRSASPAIPAVLCVALTACGAWRFGREARPVWLALTFGAALAGLGFDTSFVIGLAGLMLGYAISEGEIFGRTTWLPLVKAHGARALVIALGVAVALDTSFLMSPSGLQAGLIDPLWRWSNEVARGAGLTAPLLVGLLDGAILFLAVVGLLDYRERPRVIRFLGTWLLVSLTLASLMRMPDLRYLAHPVLPACLLAGFGVRRLACWIASGGSTLTLVIALVGLVPVITSSFQINAGLKQGVSPWGAAGVVLIGGLILVGLLAYNLLRDVQLKAAFAIWVSVILVFGVIAGGSRALEARGAPRGQLAEQSMTTSEIELIRQAALKWYRAEPGGTIPVDASLRPVLGWPLRDVPTVRFDQAARDQPQARIVADPPALTGPGLDIVRLIVGYNADWSSLSLQPSRLWNWITHRESLVTLRPYAIVLIQPAGPVSRLHDADAPSGRVESPPRGQSMVQVIDRPRLATAPAPEPPAQAFAWQELLPYLVLAAVGLALRFYHVGDRAFHHDESLHAVYSWYLYVGRGYIHDPLMHGPYQFHLPALMYFLFGDNNVTARLTAILHGTGIIILPYFLRNELGRRGAIVASLLFMISPAFLYFSRFMREDIYLAFLTLGMVVGIFGWLRTRNVRYLWFGSLSLICAFADKEATYIHVFVFLTFFFMLWATAQVHSKWPEVWDAIKAIQVRTWIECLAIFGVVYVLLFTTFFTNLGDPWNCLRGLPCSKGGIYSGSLGALLYWIEQHDVQRGGQPIYYYVLQLMLYEFLPLVFAIAAVTTAWFRRSVFGWFLAYWFVGNFVIYSWAGEKMPWLVPHIAMPLVLLAGRWLGDWSGTVRRSELFSRPSMLATGLGIGACLTFVAYLAVTAAEALGQNITRPLTLEKYTLLTMTVAAIAGLIYLKFGKRVNIGTPLVIMALVVLSAFYIRTSWMVTYAHGDIPVEMLVYVQSSPDIPWVVDEIQRIGFQTGQRDELRILMDNGYIEEVGGQRVPHEAVSWPFEWYLRDYKNRRYYSKTIGPDINLRDYPVILVMAPNVEPIRDQLGDYVGQKYRLNWWFPEDYKAWGNDPGAILRSLSDPTSRAKFLKFLLYREPMNILGAREFYLFVRKEVPTLGPASTTTPPPPGAPRQAAPITVTGPRVAVAEPLDPTTTLYGVGQAGDSLLFEPKGVALGPDGKIYVSEGRASRITVFNPDGTIATSWGRNGTGEGELNEPWGLAVAPNGDVFVADTWNHRIQRYAADGRFITSWGGLVDTSRDPQGAPGRFWGPRSIAIGPDGLIYVTDTGNKRIQAFDENGTFVRAFGGAGTEPGKFNEPVGLAFDGDTLVVADAWNGRIQRLDRNGAPLGEIAIQGWESHSVANKPYIAAGPDGWLYVTLPERNEILQVSPDGQATSVARPADRANRLGMPTGLVVGQNNVLYSVESSGGVLTRAQLGAHP